MSKSISVNYSVKITEQFFKLLIVSITVLLAACGNKDNKTGQALVRVNGEEITIHQINDELHRAGTSSDQQELATKQILETLIDRQLVVAEAKRNKIDRLPETIQAIERAKSQIITQAYFKSFLSKIAKPSKSEISDYFEKHPDYFTQRKQYDMQQVIIAPKDLGDDLMPVIDTAQTLEVVVKWLDLHKVQYSRGKMSRYSSDLPEKMIEKIKELRKGQLFIVNEGDKKLLNSIVDIKSSPVSEEEAGPQITQYLINTKTKEAADAEIAHLRSTAKIQYLNASAPIAP